LSKRQPPGTRAAMTQYACYCHRANNAFKTAKPRD